MALYGPYTPSGFIPFTGYSPTLGQNDATTGVTSGLVQFDGMTQEDSRLSYALRRSDNLPFRQLLLTLLGAAAGGTATQTRTRVQAVQSTYSPTDFGGAVPVETVNLINRATTSGDLADVQAALTRTPVPTYATDASGNSGGGKLGF